jgi:hypothetical protein
MAAAPRAKFYADTNDLQRSGQTSRCSHVLHQVSSGADNVVASLIGLIHGRAEALANTGESVPIPNLT